MNVADNEDSKPPYEFDSAQKSYRFLILLKILFCKNKKKKINAKTTDEMKQKSKRGLSKGYSSITSSLKWKTWD